MPYNLLRERWIPIRRRSGKADWIAPHQIAEREDPPIAIASPRPDFDGALIQFLIGLMQTTAAPKGEREWHKYFESPHTPDQLRERFDSVEPAFNLDGDGPRFMQDLTLDSAQGAPEPIGALLIDRMGEDGLADKSDLFMKPGLIPELGYAATAAALFSLQTNAPAGGSGNRTSLRGGGPLSTLVVGESLVQTLWLNVLTEADFLGRFGNRELTNVEAQFPWMGPTRTSDSKAGGTSTTPADIHPAQHFWAMPRRIRLQFVDRQFGQCAVTGETNIAVVKGYIAKNLGVKYEGDFRHPLTPYSVVKPGEPLNPKKAKDDGVPYRDWPQFVAGDAKHEPARVVQAFHSERRFTLAKKARMWAFGFEMENMKPRAWHWGITPLIAVEPGLQAAFRDVLERLVEASESVRRTLLQKVKEAIARRPQDLPGDIGAMVNAAFWSKTEAAFFETVLAVRDALPAGPLPDSIGERWLADLHRAAKSLFQTYSQMNGEFSATDVKRVAIAWSELRRYTAPSSPVLRKAVGLPVPESNKPKPKSRKGSKKEVTP